VLATPDDVDSLATAAVRAMHLARSDSRARAVAICDAETMIDGYEALYAEMCAEMRAKTAAPPMPVPIPEPLASAMWPALAASRPAPANRALRR